METWFGCVGFAAHDIPAVLKMLLKETRVRSKNVLKERCRRFFLL